jgi:hypothetical protein
MNKWLKIGIVFSIALAIVAILGAAALFFVAGPAYAFQSLGAVGPQLPPFAQWGPGFDAERGPRFGPEQGPGFGPEQGFGFGLERGPRFGPEQGPGFGPEQGFGFGPGVGHRGGRGFLGGGPFGGLMGDGTYLADALGITVAELQTARQEAHIAAIQQLVDEGVLTQAQADQLLLGGRPAFFGGRGQLGDVDIDPEALLANALGITVEALQAAQQQAHVAAIQQAVADGRMTQAQADLALGYLQLRDAIDSDALLAGVLGITVDELQAARDEGKTLADLVDELGLDAATVRREMTAAYQQAVQQAVDDGTITQAQADQVLSRPGPGFGGFGGRGHFPGWGGFGGPAEGPGGRPGRGYGN